MKAVKLKSQLMLLAAGSLLPLLVFAIVAVVVLIDHERTTMEQESMGRVASAMSAIDAEVNGSIMTLQALAASKSLQSGDLRAFHDEARRVLATRPNWRNIGLASVSGEQLIDAILPFGQAAPFARDDDTFERALRTGQPAVGSVRPGTAVADPSIRVRVPVIVDGAVKYVLAAPIKPATFAALLRAQQVQPDWVIALVDRNRKFIARIPEAPLGDPISATFSAALDRGPLGWFRGRTVDGRDVFTPYVTSSLSGWVLGLAIPASTVQAAALRTSAIAAGGGIIALALALTLAWLMARRIAAPIASLAQATEAMGRGAEVDVRDPGRVAEVALLHDALRDASAAIRQRQQSVEGEKAALERERLALQAADTAKDEFIAMLSHELRNPLAALMTAIYLLKMTRLTDPDMVCARDVADRQVKQMARLIEDLLDVSRIATGKANLEPEPFDLAEAARQVIEAWRAGNRFAAHEVTLDSRAVTIFADRTRMEQILANLLDNAIKFTPAKGNIRVTVGPENGYAALTVADNGEGIEPAALPGIFDLFIQANQGLARHKGGLGVGLSIVKRLAELQGGRVEAWSGGPGLGSTFVVRLPSVDRRAVSTVKAQQAPDTDGVQNGKRILVIEDNDDARAMLRVALSLNGHDVREARDGSSGIALAAQFQPDIVFVDIGLPDIDGYHVARALRAQFDADLMLFAVTGYGQVDDRNRALDAGFDAHLTKPVSLEALEQTIAAATARRSAEEPAPTTRSA